MRRFIVPALSALSAAVLLCSPLAAQTYTWTGVGFNTSMAANTNWVGNVTPPSGDPNLKLVFTGSNNGPNQDIAPTLSVQALEFNNFFQVQGNAFQLNNLGANPSITINSGSPQFYAPIAFNAPTAISGTGGLQLYAATTGSGNLTLSSSGSLGVSLNGTGTSLTGSVNVNSGAQLNVGVTGALAGTLNVAGGYVTFQNFNVLATGADMNLSAGSQVDVQVATNVDNLDVSGNSVVYLSGGQLTVTGGVSSSSGSNTIGSAGGTIALGGPTTINITSTGADQLNINSQITTGSITKTGVGRLTLGGFTANTFTGTNTVSAGILRGGAAQIGNVLNNSTVELAGGTLNTTQITGPGNVVIVGGTNYNVAQIYGGTTTIDNGSLSGFVNTLPALLTGVGGGGGVTFQDVGNVTSATTIAGPLFVSKVAAGVLTLNGNNPYTFGTSVGFGGGGFAIGSDTAIGTGPLYLGDVSNTLEAIGSRTLANQLYVGNGATFQGSGNFNFTDATDKQLLGSLVHNSTGSTTIAGKHAVTGLGSITVNAGSLALGNGAVVNGFTSAGPVTVNGGTLSLNSLNFINLPTVTIAGGTLNVPNGYAIPLGAVLQGTGGVTGRLATANGSTIIASGNMTLGDAAHPAGVNLDGELYTNNNTVTLDDSNQAVLGSLTDIGTATLNGTLVAPNGLVLNFGRNVIGRGQIQSNNTLADAVIVNGDVNGDAFATPLVFTGYVKGVGTLNNVAFAGTFAPGLSPTLMTVGNTILLPSNVLDMEIGGLNRGSQYDAFDVTPASTMLFDGTLKVTLFNAYAPNLGDQFDLFNGTTTGVFSSYNFPALNPGLAWDTSMLYTQGILQVVTNIPEPAAWTLALVGVVALVKRRRI